jgi:hypothetical protein
MSDATVWSRPGSPVPAFNAGAAFAEQYFTATANQSVFTITAFTYTPGNKTLHVYVNGVKQRRGIDFAETSSTTFTLDTGLDVGDTVMAEAFSIRILV